MENPLAAKVEFAYQRAKERLLASRSPGGYWIGRLASSAVSTATALSALSLVRRSDPGQQPERFGLLIERGAAWLAAHQNADGGWGDTDRSYSNIATTILAVAALRLSDCSNHHAAVVERGVNYIKRNGFVEAVFRRYGRDRTFAAPILANAALAGMVDWRDVPRLPFELACLPQDWYRFLHLPVVSYAIPALVAIGQLGHAFRPTRLWPWRWVRGWAVEPSLRVLEAMLPESGGYLEATPLTSFVVMSLAACRRADHPVARRGVEFLVRSVREDGSWPIDTNLATWLTTLAINALAHGGENVSALLGNDCLDWLLGCQHRTRHPFTGAEPGGWGWTDLSGAVPDADDTPGALLALSAWHASSSPGDAQQQRIEEAIVRGVNWLLDLQNRDGGWPTFCRGWGKLPFDRSGADLTAHALRALRACQHIIARSNSRSSAALAARCARAVRRGFRYLANCQRSDGSWIPLWFGNQDHPDELNPVYGTARVLLAYQAWGLHDTQPFQRAWNWLVGAQNCDGSWSIGLKVDKEKTGSIEETAVALEALAADPSPATALERGIAWLTDRMMTGDIEPSPIGFYFAKLWYYEELYPWIFAVSALGRLRNWCDTQAGGPLGQIRKRRVVGGAAAR